MQDLGIIEPLHALPPDWALCRRIIHDLSEIIPPEDQHSPAVDQDQPVEDDEEGTPSEPASDSGMDSVEDASLPQLFKLRRTWDHSGVKPFPPPGFLKTAQPLYHTPPADCPKSFRRTPISLLSVLLNMKSAGILAEVLSTSVVIFSNLSGIQT